MNEIIDINENNIMNISPQLLNILLQDKSSGKNIIWATDSYESLGVGYRKKDEIQLSLITGENNMIIKPRVLKSKLEKTGRIKNNAEVYTPSWMCNIQNNLIDDLWFDNLLYFNKPCSNGWKTSYETINFSLLKNKTWKDYVSDPRMEITCGEAPYLTSRYDAVQGNYIEVPDRIGLLDRKLRIINENVKSKEEWIEWAGIALKNIYGYEFQGDSLLLARENVLFTTIEHYKYKYNDMLNISTLCQFAKIITWNIWQMDGLKYVVPYSCHNENIITYTLFGDTEVIIKECDGCRNHIDANHNGIYCMIKDWQENKTLKYISLVRGV